MVGFGGILTGIGTGLGGFMEGYERSRKAASDERLKQEQLQEIQRERQAQRQAGIGLRGALGSGIENLGSGGMPPPAPAGDTPDLSGFSDPAGSPAQQQPTQYQQPPSGSGFSSGLSAGGNEWSPGLKRLIDLGVSPAAAQGAIGYMAKNESGNNPLAVNPTSGALGRAQWLGPRKAALTAQYGPKPTDDQQAEFMAGELQGPERGTLAQLASAKTTKEGYDIWGKSYERPGQAALAKAGVGGRGGGLAQNLPPELQQAGMQTARSAASQIPREIWGRTSLKAASDAIDKADPNGDPGVKFMALEHLSKMLAPDAQRAWEVFKLQHDETFRREMDLAHDKRQFEHERFLAGQQDKREDAQNKRAEAASGQKNWDVLTDPTTNQQYRYQKSTGAAKNLTTDDPYTPGGAQKLGGPGVPDKGHRNVEVTDGEGKKIFSGAAHRQGEDWIADKDNKPIVVPEDGNILIGSASGGQGRQAAAQMVRLTSAANEARRQIGNVARASLGATTSWFQGIQSESGRSLSEGLRRSLANEITPRDEQVMSTLGRGIGRSLASLETAGAATGLVNLQQNMQQLMPAKGDDVAAALTKIAEMRQIAEQGIESAMAAPSVGDAQKKLLQEVRDDIVKAVPYTVGDVLNLIQDPGADTYASFAAKIGLGTKGKQGAQGGGGADDTAPIIQGGQMFDPKTHKHLGPAPQ
jgi:tail lysozyme